MIVQKEIYLEMVHYILIQKKKPIVEGMTIQWKEIITPNEYNTIYKYKALNFESGKIRSPLDCAFSP